MAVGGDGVVGCGEAGVLLVICWCTYNKLLLNDTESNTKQGTFIRIANAET